MKVEIVSGGTPAPEELAAIVIALTPVRVAEETGATGPPPPWRRAAVLEGLGYQPVSSAADLAGRRGWSS